MRPYCFSLNSDLVTSRSLELTCRLRNLASRLYALRWISSLLCLSSADDALWQNVPRKGGRSALGRVNTKHSYYRSCDTTRWNLDRRRVRRRFLLQDRGGFCDLRQ